MKKFSEINEEKLLTYPNDKHHSDTIGWGSVTEHVHGDPKAPYVRHDHVKGEFHYTHEKGNLTKHS